MKNVGNIMLVVVAIALSPLVFVLWMILFWLAPVIGIIQWTKQSRLQKQQLPDLACSLDTDCPPGYVCVDKRCVPKRIR